MDTITRPVPKHTPGPYSYFPGEDPYRHDLDAWVIAGGSESPLATVDFWPDENGLASEEAEANVQLFTAAPELLRLVIEFVYQADRMGYADNDLPDLPMAESRAIIASLTQP